MKKKVLLQILNLTILLFIVKGCSSEGEKKTKTEVSVVDSVWVKRPGQISTLQVDPIYFGRTSDGRIYQSRSRFRVGDSLVIPVKK